MARLVDIRDLKVDLMTARGIVYALDGVNMSIGEGEIHGVVGESGCGKTITAKSVMRLLPSGRERSSGHILFEGKDLMSMKEREIRKLRGNRISMVFQDPMTSLNPLMTVGEQIGEMFTNHLGDDRETSRQKVLELLGQVGIEPPDRRIDQYPFELSGGLQQRVMIAMAIACHPSLLIADEPTTALDVTIQAQILELLQRLQRDMNMSIMLITHNFGIVAEVCDRVSVMYAGRVVETANTREIFAHPMHPYSRALIESIPKAGDGNEYLTTIPGSPPTLFGKTHGCAFVPRCEHACKGCATNQFLMPVAGNADHLVACQFALEGGVQ